MSKMLRMRSGIAICFMASVISVSAQVTGDPQILQKPSAIGPLQKSTSKISDDLRQLYQAKATRANRELLGKPAIPTDGILKYLQVKGDQVIIDVSFSGDEQSARAELQKLGMMISAVYGRVMSGLIPIAALPQLEASHIRFAKPAYRPMLLTDRSETKRSLQAYQDKKPQVVISQGDTAQRSNIARKKFDVNGKGVKVGVLSDSYDNLQTAAAGVQAGELPGPGNPFGFKKPVEVLSDLDSTGTDEGRAMTEIVHDVAPGSELAFHTAFNGEADFADGILQLAKKGCDVIVDDIIYFDEPFFQDGILAQAVDQVKKAGVTYFSAAGNQSVRSYESDYRGTTATPLGPDAGTAHNFSAPGAAVRLFQPIFIPRGGSYISSFQWDQSSFSASGVGPESDFDIYVLDINGRIVGGGASDNIASGEPVEVFGYFNNTANTTFFLLILKYSGPDVTRLKYVNFGDGQFFLTNPPIPGILAPTLVGHAKAEGAIATAAAFYLETPAYGLDTPRVEFYSSVGGVANYLDLGGRHIAPLVRKKPEITAPDGANTSFFDPFGGGDIAEDADTYPNFFGTSAAAPHAAGVAALMIQAQKLHSITPSQIKAIMATNTVDMDNPNTAGFDVGFDFQTGTGLIKADAAVDAVRFPKLYIRNLKVKALCSNDPEHTRYWEIDNPNPFEVETKWYISGFSQTGSLVAPPGKSAFSSQTVTFRNRPVPNIAVIDWKDNFGFSRFDLTYGSHAVCGVDLIGDDNSDRRVATTPGSSIDGMHDDFLEVYPNPVTSEFRIYAAIASQQTINLELYNIEGKRVYQQFNAPANGVITIPAAKYAPGVYLLKATQGGFSKTIKLLKK